MRSFGLDCILERAKEIQAQQERGSRLAREREREREKGERE